MNKKKILKTAGAYLLAATTAVSAIPAAGMTVLAENQTAIVKETKAAQVSEQLIAAPDKANLTKLGNVDWVQLGTTDFGSFNRKNVLEPSITNLNLIGRCDYVTNNIATNLIFSDGMAPASSPETLRNALVFTGKGNGFSFSVPGSTEKKCLDIYTGAWASDIKVTMTVNDEEVYTKTFGSNNATPGTPAKYQVLQLDYSTASDDDVVKVTVEVEKVYDANWGNMNIAAITLGTERAEDDGSIIGGTVKNAPVVANLTSEGNLDWMYLNNATFENYNRKNMENHMISDVTLIGKAQSNPISNKTKTAFAYTDGMTPEEESGIHKAFVFQGQGSGVEFTLPGSTTTKYVNFYAGAWAADVKIDVLVNGQVQYSTSFGSSSTVPDTTNYQVARLQYKTAKDTDKVQVRAVVSKAYDPTWGNMNVSAVTVSDTEAASLEESIKTDEWQINHTGGELQSLKTKIGGEMYNIPVRTDQYGGFAWKLNGKKIMMLSNDTQDDGSIVYTGKYKADGKDLTFTMKYSVNEKKQMVVTATMKNNQGEEVAIDQASIQLGFNTYLERYPDYNDQLFPTLLRCEKTHAWGYFSTPSGRLMTIATDSPVASYTLDYQSGAHRIYSASLDVMQSGKLPERHPQDLNKLAANEEKTWNIYLKPVEDLNAIEDVKGTISENTELPMFDADRYTLAKGEESQITVLSESGLKNDELSVEAPDGTVSKIAVTKDADGKYKAVFEAGNQAEGVYKVIAENESGYLGEMTISIRKDWSWYTKKARQAAVEAPQKGSSHAETYYGLYSAYIAKKYFPDAKWDNQIDEKFEEIYPLMYDVNTGLPTSWENRIQNHSTTLGVFVDKYESSGNRAELDKAEGLADFLMTKQKEDGGYYNGGTDYTSVIYPAKSIMELTHVEKRLKDDASLSEEDRAYFTERYELHMDSLTRAMDRLVSLDGDFSTEGQGTFEDGANSCSATQLSEFALMFPEGSAERAKYTEAARKIVDFHTSHQQSIIPDSRMNGGTLRFWEAQYDVEMRLTSTAPNMMNSPHGWSAWNIYALFNMYELTGDTSYLERGMNAMGSCAQLMGFDGMLNWAFVADPQRDTKFFVKDEEKSEGEKIVGKHIQKTIGEEYVPMISYWWRAPKNTWVPGYTAMGGSVTQGACCDNDVHEVFKALGEVALTKAYVVEKEDGSFETYNATAEKVGDIVKVTPSEDVVSNVSVQLLSDKNVEVNFYDGVKTELVTAGKPVWVSTKENAVDTSKLSKDSSLSNLTVSGGVLDKEFHKDVLEYSAKLKAEPTEVTIIPTASNEKEIIYVDGNKVESGEGYTIQMDALTEKDVKIRVKSEMQSGETTYSIRLSTMGDKVILSTEGQTATAGSEQPLTGGEGPAAFVLDGNASTLWHTRWSGVTAPMEDRWIDIKLAEEEAVCGLRYLPRPSGDNGKIKKYEIHISNDNGVTYKKVAEGSWDMSKDWKVASFTEEKATNVRLVPTETSWEFASGAEIRIIAAGEELQEPADKADLADLIAYADSQKNSADYQYVVPAVKVAFEKALEEARAVNENAAATQEEVDAAYDKLLEMVQMLDFTGNSESLKVLVDAAAKLKEELYTEESWAAFADAYKTAQEVLANENALQAEIDEAAKALDKVMSELVRIPVDKSKLQKLVDQSQKYVDAIDQYTPVTGGFFMNVLEDAKAVLGNEDVTQAEIDAAYSALQNAIFGLRLVPNKDKLEDLIGKAEKVDVSEYTAESAAVFTAALDNAKVVFADANATEEQVKAAEKALKKAQKNLVAKADADKKDNDKKADDKVDSADENSKSADRAAKTGDAATALPAAVTGIAALAALLVFKKRR